MLTLTSSTIIMIIAIALIIGWAIGRKVNKRHQAEQNRIRRELSIPTESRVPTQAERDHLAASIRQHKPEEHMKGKLPPSRRTLGR